MVIVFNLKKKILFFDRKDFLSYEITAIEANLLGFVNKLFGLGDELTPTPVVVVAPPAIVVVKIT